MVDYAESEDEEEVWKEKFKRKKRVSSRYNQFVSYPAFMTIQVAKAVFDLVKAKPPPDDVLETRSS